MDPLEAEREDVWRAFGMANGAHGGQLKSYIVAELSYYIS